MASSKNFTKHFFHKFTIMFFAKPTSKMFSATVRQRAISCWRRVLASVDGITHKFKIFDSVIKPISVFMMNNFFRKWFQVTTKVSFHYKASLSNVTKIISKRMVWFKNKFVSRTKKVAPFVTASFNPARCVFSKTVDTITSFIPSPFFSLTGKGSLFTTKFTGSNYHGSIITYMERRLP